MATLHGEIPEKIKIKNQIYCDRLSWAILPQILRIKIQSSNSEFLSTVLILEEIKSDRRTFFIVWLVQILGFTVKELPFFAGHLKVSSGLSVYMAARWQTFAECHSVARWIISQSPLLSELNNKWLRNNVRLFIAQQIWLPLENIVKRILIVQAISRQHGTKPYLILGLPLAIDRSSFRNPAPEVYISSYLDYLEFPTRQLINYVQSLCQRILKYVLAIFTPNNNRDRTSQNDLLSKEHSINVYPEDRVGLLVLQEDEVSLDRSHRTQPHWYFPDEEISLPFDIHVFTHSLGQQPDSISIDKLRSHGIHFIEDVSGFRKYRWFMDKHPITKQLRGDLLACFRRIFTCLSVNEVIALINSIKLLHRAGLLVKLCTKHRISTFLCSESYRISARAMSLIAPELDIQTVAFQYSNLAVVSPAMLTTADVMFVFSPLFKERWIFENIIRPKNFVENGYVFDSSFEFIQKSAENHRQKLENAGVEFVICYFDENANNDKYGLISADDHLKELQILINLLVEKTYLGLVVKSQFLYNSPQNLSDFEDSLNKAKATGRYLELAHGTHRNNVYPAEAALVSDMVIAHAVGGTAALEAVLVGARCVLLNPYGIQSENDKLYSKADIVYASMDAALDAIFHYKLGNPEYADLGDWSQIVDQFDSFRDGQAGHRMRDLLEQIVMRDDCRKPTM